MGERRFYIVEVGEDYALPGAITESELLRRLDSIINRPDNEAIDILLHGEAKEPETESPGQWADRAWKCPHKETKKIGYDIYCKSCGVYVRTEKEPEEVIHINRACPKNCTGMKPPTDAWEEWIQEMPVDPLDRNLISRSARDLKEWFREMTRR